jgi:copper chaperone CopZ
MSDITTTTYHVTGMTCQHCADAVTGELDALPAVQSVDVDVASGAVTVTSNGPLDEAQVREAVEEAGYTLA